MYTESTGAALPGISFIFPFVALMPTGLQQPNTIQDAPRCFFPAKYPSFEDIQIIKKPRVYKSLQQLSKRDNQNSHG